MNTIRLVRPGDVRTEEEVRTGTNDVDAPTDEQVLDELVRQNGIPVRVAAMLGIDETYVYSVVSRNARALSTKLRARLMLTSFTTLISVDAALKSVLADMPADAVGRTYAATLVAFTNLAGQFEEKEADTDTDDASAAKLTLLDRLEGMADRERVAEDEAAVTADGVS